MKRRHISARERVAIFKRWDGVCHLCGGKISVGDAWEVSHDIPLEMGGADEGDNLKPAHRKCHRAHTSEVDAPQIAQAKRREAAHIGARAESKNPIRSRGFEKRERPVKLPPPPRRSIYEIAEPVPTTAVKGIASRAGAGSARHFSEGDQKHDRESD